MDDSEDVDDGEDVVTFNLRGERFKVAKRKLRALPDSLLATLAAAPSNSPSRVVPDENGEYAINRDPQYFEAMLQLYTQQGAWPPEKLCLQKVMKNVYFTSDSREVYYDVAAISEDDGDVGVAADDDEDAHVVQAATLVAAVLAATTTETSWEAFCAEVAYYQLHLAAATIGLRTVSCGSDKLIPSPWWVDLKLRLTEMQIKAHRVSIVREWCANILEQVAELLEKWTLSTMNLNVSGARSGQLHDAETSGLSGGINFAQVRPTLRFLVKRALVQGARQSDALTVKEVTNNTVVCSRLIKHAITMTDDMFEALYTSLSSAGYELSRAATYIADNNSRPSLYEIKAMQQQHAT